MKTHFSSQRRTRLESVSVPSPSQKKLRGHLRLVDHPWRFCESRCDKVSPLSLKLTATQASM